MKKKTSKKSMTLKKKILLIVVSIFLVAIISFFTGYGIYAYKLIKSVPAELTEEVAKQNQTYIKELYKEPLIQNLPYAITANEINLHAKSGILIDAATGWILYEKNADEVIPPASMTKVVLMYLALDALEKGQIKLTDKIDLPPESWAINAPPHSSLMFLGKDQNVTFEELLIGMNVVSGNDAAVAVAMTLFGTMENCIAQMNKVVQDLGLTKTRFVESSGYSENNLTTAREFAIFSRSYVTRFPESLQKYHSIKSFTYPKKHNLAPYIDYEDAKVNGVPLEGTMPITQKATNRSLDVIPGADGLKTGYIDESGYNLSLTVLRDGTRLISVTMGGPGNGSLEGNKYRTEDSLSIMDWGFALFRSEKVLDCFKVNSIAPSGKEKSFVLTEAILDNHFITIPNLKDENGNLLQLSRNVIIDEKISAPINCGHQYGKVEYYLGNYLLQTVPLVADRSISEGNIFVKLYGKIFNLF